MSNEKSHLQRWVLRVERARELQQRPSAIASALRLYEAALRFQTAVFQSRSDLIQAGVPLREQIDVSRILSEVPQLLSMSIEYGPEPLKADARALQQAGKQRWRELLEQELKEQSSLAGSDQFFARACLQPAAEHLQLQLPPDPNYTLGVCPSCGGAPQLAVLRPEGEGASRWLVCSFCLGEWAFRRIICPWCGEENKEKLPRYSAEECDYVQVEACETCKRYLKAIDMSVNGLCIPLVDELALAVLDVWATQHGYTKIARNLLGF